MKNLFTLRFAERDSFHMLIFAAVMCLVMSVFVCWSIVNLHNPHWPLYVYTPRLFFGIIFLSFWVFYMMSEISSSSFPKATRSFYSVLLAIGFPIMPLLYVRAYARNFKEYRKTQRENSDALANIFSAYTLTMCSMLVLCFIVMLFSSMSTSVVGNSVYEIWGIVVIWAFVFVTGLFELKRVNLSRSKKTLNLMFVFLPTIGLVNWFLMNYLGTLKIDPFGFLLVILIFSLPFAFWIPLAMYIHKYMQTPEKFRRYHIDPLKLRSKK